MNDSLELYNAHVSISLNLNRGNDSICIGVDNIESALGELGRTGVKLIEETPREGAGGAKIAFLHPKATGGVLVGLYERD